MKKEVIIMANDLNNNNVVTGIESDTSVTSRENKKNYNKKTYNGKNNGVGLQLKTMLKGIDRGYEVDGSISVPAQSNRIISRANLVNNKYASLPQSNPGAAIIDYLPIFGSDKRQETWAALAKQGDNLWRTIRSATPHAENYQAGDVMANLIIAAGLRYGLAEARRMMQSMVWQSTSNQFINDGIWRMLVNAYNYESLTEAQSKLVGWKNKYNGIINRLSAVRFPDIFPVFHRWEYLSSTVFRDCEDETQAQFYLFRATHLYDWEVRQDPDDPGLDLVPIHLPHNLDDLLAELDRISIKVTSDSDMSDIFADLVLAYPTAQCLKWELINTPEIGTPLKSVHSMDMKWALHNAQIVNINAPTWHIVPKDGSVYGIMFAPTGKRQIGFKPPIMATNNESMNMEKFFNLSQWVVYDSESIYESSSAGLELINVPTEILTGVEIGTFYWEASGEHLGERRVGVFNSNSWASYLHQDGTNPPAVMSWTIPASMWAKLGAYLSFAFAPLLRSYFTERPSDVAFDALTPTTMVMTTYMGALTEVERPFLVNADQLIQAHNASRVGLWNMPVVLLNGKRNGNK